MPEYLINIPRIVLFMWAALLAREAQPVERADVMVHCDTFVENADSRCTCQLQRTARLIRKCSTPVGQVKLKLCHNKHPNLDHTNNNNCSICIFTDYTLGLVSRVTGEFRTCKLLNDGFPDSVYTMEVSVLGEGLLQNGNDFFCLPNCLGGVLTQNRTGIPIKFSPDCLPGFYGPHCNLSCDAQCADTVCDRHSGNCSLSTGSKGVATLVAAVISAPLGIGLVAFIAWCCHRAREAAGLANAVADTAQEIVPDDNRDSSSGSNSNQSATSAENAEQASTYQQQGRSPSESEDISDSELWSARETDPTEDLTEDLSNQDPETQSLEGDE